MCTANGSVRAFAALQATGASRRSIAAAVRAGSLTVVRRGVYASDHACRAAVDAAAHGGALACVSAARHLGLWVLDETDAVHTWMRQGGRVHGHPGCACVPHWDGGRAADPLAAPSLPRILRQILRCRGVEEFFVVLESALRRRMLSRSQLAWLHEHTNDLAREAILLARDDADSGLESLLRWRLRTHGLRIRTQVRIHDTGIVDILIGDRLLVEADGRGNHEGAALRHKDLVRDARSAAWGYVTLRFDYALIVHDWDLVEAAILGQLDAGHHLSRPL